MSGSGKSGGTGKSAGQGQGATVSLSSLLVKGAETVSALGEKPSDMAVLLALAPILAEADYYGIAFSDRDLSAMRRGKMPKVDHGSHPAVLAAIAEINGLLDADGGKGRASVLAAVTAEADAVKAWREAIAAKKAARAAAVAACAPYVREVVIPTEKSGDGDPVSVSLSPVVADGKVTVSSPSSGSSSYSAIDFAVGGVYGKRFTAGSKIGPGLLAWRADAVGSGGVEAFTVLADTFGKLAPGSYGTGTEKPEVTLNQWYTDVTGYAMSVPGVSYVITDLDADRQAADTARAEWLSSQEDGDKPTE